MRNKKGLTIIECLLSIIILAVMLTAGMAFYFNAQASMRWSEHKRIAVEMANAEMENIKNIYANPPISPQALGSGGLWLERSGTTNGIINIGNLNGCYKNVYIDPVIAVSGYKHIRVEAIWHEADKNSPSTVSLDTYIASP